MAQVKEQNGTSSSSSKKHIDRIMKALICRQSMRAAGMKMWVMGNGFFPLYLEEDWSCTA